MFHDEMPTLTPALKHLSETEIDYRTDEKIEKLISTHRPIRHEKNCWTFWHSGFKNMPRWCKRNVVGWARRLGPEWDVRCTDMVEGSPNHALNFIDAQYLPDCFLRKNMTGNTPAQHASDLVRLPLVYLHGGVWMDCGTVLLHNFDDSFWDLLENPECPYEMFVTNSNYQRHEGQILNGFFGARRGNPFIGRWRRVFFELWKERTDCIGLRYHPLIRHLSLIDGANADRIGLRGPKGNSAHIMVDYLAQDYCFERVRLVVDDADDWDGPAYYRKHVCFLDAEREYFKYAALMPTELHHRLMSLPSKPELAQESEENLFGRVPGAASLASDPNFDELSLQQAARDWLNNISSSCLAVKSSGDYWWPGSGWAMLLPDHEDDDIIPGTWAEWFRYSSTDLQQTQKVPLYGNYCSDSSYSKVPGFLQAEAERVLLAGLLEPALESDGWDFIPQFEARL